MPGGGDASLGVRERNGQELGERSLRVGERHVLAAGDEHDHCAALLDAGADVRDFLVQNQLGVEVAEDHHVELAPRVASGRQAARLGVTELARRVRSRELHLLFARKTVRLGQDVLQVDGLVASVEEVAQVPELPARTPVGDQHVRAVIRDGDIERPHVVLLLEVAVGRLDDDAVVERALLLRLVGEAEVLRPLVGIDLEVLVVKLLVAQQEADDRLRALELLGPQCDERVHLLAEEEALGRPDFLDGEVGTVGDVADDDGRDLRALAGEEPRDSLNVCAGRGPSVGHEHRARELFGRNPRADLLQRGGVVGDLVAEGEALDVVLARESRLQPGRSVSRNIQPREGVRRAILVASVAPHRQRVVDQKSDLAGDLARTVVHPDDVRKHPEEREHRENAQDEAGNGAARTLSLAGTGVVDVAAEEHLDQHQE